MSCRKLLDCAAVGTCPPLARQRSAISGRVRAYEGAPPDCLVRVLGEPCQRIAGRVEVASHPDADRTDIVVGEGTKPIRGGGGVPGFEHTRVAEHALSPRSDLPPHHEIILPGDHDAASGHARYFQPLDVVDVVVGVDAEPETDHQLDRHVERGHGGEAGDVLHRGAQVALVTVRSWSTVDSFHVLARWSVSCRRRRRARPSPAAAGSPNRSLSW